MSDQLSSQLIQSMKIQLEVLPDEQQPADIADTDDVGQSLVDQLRNDGYTVNPTSTSIGKKEKGGPLFDILIQIPHFIHDNKELLSSIFEAISLTLQSLLIVHDVRAEREKAQRDPIKFTLEVNGKPMTITTDAKNAVKLLEQFQNAYPDEAKKVTPQSNVKIKVNVPKKKHRHSH